MDLRNRTAMFAHMCTPSIPQTYPGRHAKQDVIKFCHASILGGKSCCQEVFHCIGHGGIEEIDIDKEVTDTIQDLRRDGRQEYQLTHRALSVLVGKRCGGQVKE